MILILLQICLLTNISGHAHPNKFRLLNIHFDIPRIWKSEFTKHYQASSCKSQSTISQCTSKGCSVAESACNAGDVGLIPGSGRSPGEGNGNPLQYSCLENSMDGGAWQTRVHGIAKRQTQWSNTFYLLGSYLLLHSLILPSFLSKNPKRAELILRGLQPYRPEHCSYPCAALIFSISI